MSTASPGIRVLPSGSILRLKGDATSRPARFKARLVALGDLQDDLVEYTELYAPIACIELVRTVLAVVVAKGWSVDQVYAKSAFLHAPLERSDHIWNRLPSTKSLQSVYGQVVHLVKSLYGLKQAPKLLV